MAEAGRDLTDTLFGAPTATAAPVDQWRQTLKLDDLERQYQLPSGLMTSVLRQESGGDPRVKSSAGAQGIFQFMPATARQYKIDPFDPQQAAPAAAKELSSLYRKYHGDVDMTLAAWNWGQGNVDRKGLANMPSETRGFLTNVKRFLGPGVAEAAPPTGGRDLTTTLGQSSPGSGGSGRDLTDMLFGATSTAPPPASPQIAPQATTPTPPTGTSTPEQDAAYRASVGQQAPATAPQTAPAPTTQPGASQAPPAPSPDPSPTPGMRLQALPSITQLEPADRIQKTKLFESLKPPQQEEFLRSEEPTAGGLAMGGGPVAQSQPVTDPAALLAVGKRPPGWREGDPLPAGAKRPPTPTEAPVEEGITAPSTMIPLLMPGAGAKAVLPFLAKAPAAVGRLVRPLTEGISQTLGYGTGKTIETGEVPSAGDLGTTLGVTTALGGVLEQAAPIVAKAGNALRGVVKSAYQPIVDLAEHYGVRLSYGDVTKGAVAPKVEAALESVPLSGAGRMRVGQQADVTKAAETVRAGLQTEMQAIPWRNLPALQRAAQQGNPQAQALLNEISAAGDDWGRVIQASGKLNLWQDRQRANQLYGRVEKLAQPLGNMPVKRTIDAMDNAIDDVTNAVLPSPELQREVNTLMSRAKTELTPAATGAVPDTTYSRMKRLREDLGDMQRTATDPRTARYLGQVKNALQEDMREFAVTSKVPALVKAHKQADDFYRTRVVPYREGQLAKAIEKDLPDEIYGKFVRQGADRAQFFYKGLDQRGQAAVRYGMVDEAVKDAASTQHPDVFSPARFVASMRRIQDASGVFFKGAPQWEINGVTKLMQHAQRAGQYAENPPTGVRTGVGALALGTGAVSIPTALQALLSAQGLRIMLMTQRGRNFLLAASDMQPGSSALQRHLDTFLRTMPAASGPVGAAARSTEESPARAQ